MPYIIFKVISAIIDLLFYSTVLLFKDSLFNILFFLVVGLFYHYFLRVYCFVLSNHIRIKNYGFNLL